MKHNMFACKKSTLKVLLLGAASGAFLCACSDDSYSPDPAKDWKGTTNTFIPTDENGNSTYYQPSIGRCGDPMPFYDQKSGEFRVMYLQDYEQNLESYHPIWCVSTKDCANYDLIGEVLPAGMPAEQDAGVGTGCCVYSEEEGVYYLYYTGHNASCPQTEAVMRATSKDGKQFTKDNLWMLRGADYLLSQYDFRDPQIFRGDDDLWHMVISSRLKFAEFTSPNLKDWTFLTKYKMVWGRMAECPDIFQMGQWWYLIYSDQDAFGRCVKYIKAQTLADLRTAIENSDMPRYNGGVTRDEGKLDNRGFFAGKTASNGTDRYIWGWCPYRNGADIWAKNTDAVDNKEPNWAGALVCHKLVQLADGNLVFGEVPGIRAKYNKRVTPTVFEKTEGAEFDGDGGTLKGFGMVRFGRLGYHNHISMTIKPKNPNDKFGLCFVRSGDEEGKANHWFQIGFNNLHYNAAWNNECKDLYRVEFKQEGHNEKGEYEDKFVNGALSHFVPRPADNTYNIDIYTDNSVVVLYYNNILAYTTRIYGIQKNGWSINSYGGEIEVSGLKVWEY